MPNYNDLPLFPLHVVLYPEMPLPLHIFEPRYREMILRCREENSPFGVILIQHGEEVGKAALTHSIGTTARITHYEELPDGQMDILVMGETRFRVQEIRQRHAYLTACVEPLDEAETIPIAVEPTVETVSGMFKDYVRALFAQAGRTLSILQLPQEPARLSYAIATFLPISLSEKQGLLEINGTETRLERELEILSREMEAQDAFANISPPEEHGVIVPADAQALGRLSSRN
jgi:Lon protease-like protein